MTASYFTIVIYEKSDSITFVKNARSAGQFNGLSDNHW